MFKSRRQEPSCSLSGKWPQGPEAQGTPGCSAETGFCAAAGRDAAAAVFDCAFVLSPTTCAVQPSPTRAAGPLRPGVWGVAVTQPWAPPAAPSHCPVGHTGVFFRLLVSLFLSLLFFSLRNKKCFLAQAQAKPTSAFVPIWSSQLSPRRGEETRGQRGLTGGFVPWIQHLLVLLCEEQTR